MNHLVLGVGYTPQEYEIERTRWQEYGIVFDFADGTRQAMEKLREADYVCIAIRSDKITNEDMESLRAIQALPTLILPPSYTIDERYACVHFSAMQYARATGRKEVADLGGRDSVQHYLHIPSGQRKPLTIITVHDLCFCLEHRSVEIRGKEIELTEKEFDILALMIMNQRQVFTPDMIMDTVWQEDYDFYSKGAVSTHISNLRRKLKVAPDVPDYIQTVHRVGYKFDAPR